MTESLPPQENDEDRPAGGPLRLRPDAVDWREVEGEVVALDRISSTYLAINAAGAALWPALVRGTDQNELVALLLAEFTVDEARAWADVEAFVSMLARRDLLER
ncbi:MAG TPA: PqqD family protein [Acidimicrobiales bacterium]|nr:PqqD family protein [Acidimicrobiales bacterium]